MKENGQKDCAIFSEGWMWVKEDGERTPIEIPGKCDAFMWTNQFSGSIIAISLIFVLMISFVNTMNEILGMERDKQQAITSNEAKGLIILFLSQFVLISLKKRNTNFLLLKELIGKSPYSILCTKNL